MDNVMPFRMNPVPMLPEMLPVIPIENRWRRDIDGRGWKRKTRKAITNFRSGNKKKLRQFCK